MVHCASKTRNDNNFSFLKKFFFLMWTIFKVIIEFVTILFLFSCFGFLTIRYVES